jgi:hypothetical protein
MKNKMKATVKTFDRTAYFARLQTQKEIDMAELALRQEIAAKSVKVDAMLGKTIETFGRFESSILLTFTDGTQIVFAAEKDTYDDYVSLDTPHLSLEMALKYDLVDGTALAAAKEVRRVAQDKASRAARARTLIDGLHELEKVFGADKVKEMLDNNAE